MTLDEYCDEHRLAQQADYVAFTGRHSFTTDAYGLGFAVGWRQHTSGHQDRHISRKWAKRLSWFRVLFTGVMIILGGYLLYTTYLS